MEINIKEKINQRINQRILSVEKTRAFALAGYGGNCDNDALRSHYAALNLAHGMELTFLKELLSAIQPLPLPENINTDWKDKFKEWANSDPKWGVNNLSKEQILIVTDYIERYIIETTEENIAEIKNWVQQTEESREETAEDEMLTWFVMAYGALEELVFLKKYKDLNGKDDLYNYRQPKAWDMANDVINLWKKSDYGAKPIPKAVIQEDSLLLSFCHFLGTEGYKINGYDDGQLKVVIGKFLQSASLTPIPSINDSESLIEEIRQIKAVIIHFATLDKMPTLELLNRERLIDHVVTRAKNILNKYPPKTNGASINKQS